MEAESFKIITMLISLIAITISIITIVMTRKNLKRQLRLAKLEEILEILQFIIGYYRILFSLFHGIEKNLNSLETSNEITKEMRKTMKQQIHFIEINNREIVTSKIARLKILSNAYLTNSNNLKIKLHTISDVFYNMYMYVHSNGGVMRKKEANVIIPNPKEMSMLIEKIEEEIIIEMNLGYKPIDYDVQVDYYKNQFKRDLEG
ncbi:hypothetical protein FLA105534_00263 [Flavobacterium bizetiae]|uniref:Uncharacterized protein n=1 Tax=Flavobacterium bizetiae TaxID=2704140 RepID=A0A6J4G6W2_9FLAO|nr:hypothetical protein [Flavobacterium bizetiae]CAA9194673.1 hypothetical protein FLA105534_00263 [Flavobacterium bizetiae]CAD5343604.1 hypothetical protein FLA105535_03604 [Flavobacterium bizetiae]CAD5347797.1 hypothetical protein FLA105534_01756 [Flavobacterium bizetiae]